jgi:hypothetical protein
VGDPLTLNERRAALAGLVIVVVWASLAAWSGRISPLARRPLLDITGPLAPYRWVDPPPELAASNLPPVPGSFRMDLDVEGVRLFFTKDNQVTVIVRDRAIAPAPGERSVKLAVDPIDPSELPQPGGKLVAFGNAVRIEAVYLPSRTPVSEIRKGLDVALIYPQTSTLQAASHQILFSADGTRWQKLETSDALVMHQASATIPGFGTVLVAAVPEEVPINPPGSDRSPFLTVAVVVAACVILVGVGLILRTRTPRRPS